MGEGGEERPFNFFKFCVGVIAGGTAGVVVETILYPIDTIKTRLHAAQGGSKIEWKGLYSRLAGNLAGVLLASVLFVGIYEPAKRKLLEIFPENLSAVAHLGPLVELLFLLFVFPRRWSNKECKLVNSSPRLMLFASSLLRKDLKGYDSFLLRDLPFHAIQFCIYEQLRIGYKLAVLILFVIINHRLITLDSSSLRSNMYVSYMTTNQPFYFIISPSTSWSLTYGAMCSTNKCFYYSSEFQYRLQ